MWVVDYVEQHRWSGPSMSLYGLVALESELRPASDK